MAAIASMLESICHPVADATDVAFVRRAILSWSQAHGIDEKSEGALALLVTELATNILKHAGDGKILARGLPESGGGVELLALDTGPGMRDVPKCRADGYSTAGSPGTGFGALSRMSHEMDVWSQPTLGTAVRVVLYADAATARAHDAARAGGPNLRWGAVSVAVQGEMLCGDGWSLAIDGPAQATVLLADGLGHGPLAHAAAQAVTSVMTRDGSASLEQILIDADLAARGTRGAAVGVARLDLAAGLASFSGIGNIAASVWHPDSHRQLISHNGIIGHTMRRPQRFDVPWPSDAVLILHSDGLATRWNLAAYPGLWLRHPALIAGILYRDHERGRDDTSVVVLSPHLGGG